jgi:hypothetical protein
MLIIYLVYEPNISSTVQNRQRVQMLFRNVAIAIAEGSGLPPAGFQEQVQWFQNCLSVTLGLLVPPASNTTSPFVSNLTEQIANVLRRDMSSIAVSIVGVQGIITSVTQPASATPAPRSVSPSSPSARIVGDQQAHDLPAREISSLPQDARTEELLPPTQHLRTTEGITSDAVAQHPVTLAPAIPTQPAEEATPGPARDDGRAETQTPLGSPPNPPACQCCNDSGTIWVESSNLEEEWLPCVCNMFDFSPMPEDTLVALQIPPQ